MRLAGAESGYELTAQHSSDAEHWQGTGFEERILAVADGVETVEASVSVARGPAGFLRLHYDRP